MQEENYRLHEFCVMGADGQRLYICISIKLFVQRLGRRTLIPPQRKALTRYTPPLETISILVMTQQYKLLRIGLYIIITILTGLACLDLLSLAAAAASSHNVPVKTFRVYQVTFIGLVLIDTIAIYQLRKLKNRKMSTRE